VSEDSKANAQADAQAEAQQKTAEPTQLDPAFFTCVNEYLELTTRQAKQQGLKRISMASLYAAARFNAVVYLASVGPNAAEERKGFLDYMGELYRRMLNEHIDGLGAERGIDVGVSELAAEYAAAGYSPSGSPVTPADDSAAG
jgi:phage terminase Nu1 subunit (DNA packaging protein)